MNIGHQIWLLALTAVFLTGCASSKPTGEMLIREEATRVDYTDGVDLSEAYSLVRLSMMENKIYSFSFGGMGLEDELDDRWVLHSTDCFGKAVTWLPRACVDKRTGTVTWIPQARADKSGAITWPEPEKK